MLGFLLVFSATMFAQEDTTAAEKTNSEVWYLATAPKVYKFSPLDVFSVIPTFGLDVEVQLPRPTTSLQVGVGIVPNMFQILSNSTFNDYKWMRGYKVRSEYRAYFPNSTSNYISFGLSLRHLIIRKDVAVGMEPFQGQFGQTEFAFFQNTSMIFNRFTTDLAVKIGTQIETNANVILDLYAGLSLRGTYVQSNSTMPIGALIVQQRGIWQLEDGHKRNYPLPLVGIKIGFKR